jgi:cellulose synthase/poly-beta-1,6-N-acetylglucosamine synthase-like glycosyltransferase
VSAVINGVVGSFLLLYGLNAYWLTFNCRPRRFHPQFHRQPAPSFAAVGCSRAIDRAPEQELPIVTVQLPIFNERYVARRLLEAVCRLDYPHDRLYIQVLDDSTDDTTVILQNAVAEFQQQGYWVDYLHRQNRRGYKAGALQDAMALVQGEYVAIFDADFVPEPDWLKRTIAHYLANPDQPIAVVQTRWGHLNSEYSLLTKIQATMMDGHFAIEERCRYLRNYFLIFHGTAGIWNKRAIIEAGGWHGDTLAEDMDLSYRAQLLGWKIIYDHDIVAPAELPVTISAFKVQQFRWNKGIAQCSKKFLWRIWRSHHNWMVKLQATLHLTCCFPILLSLLVSLTSLPTVLSIPTESPQWRVAFDGFWGLAMAPVTFGWPFLYAMAQRQIYPRTWHRRLLRVLFLIVVATGTSLNNSRAVLAGLLNTGATFQRTPKFAIQQKNDRWTDKIYRLPFDGWSLLELAIGIYGAIALAIAIYRGLYAVIPFMLLTTVGFLYVGGLSIWQVWQQNRGLRKCGRL